MPRQIVFLRALVGFLGEEDQHDWWNTSFLSRTGQRFLQRTFPRSAFTAGVHSVTVAARRLHDRSIGKGKVGHLFRLPPAREREMAEALRDIDPRPILESVADREAALSKLKEMSRAVSATKGAVRVGRRKDLFTSDGLGRVAGYYSQAFTSSEKVFPYFSDA